MKKTIFLVLALLAIVAFGVAAQESAPTSSVLSAEAQLCSGISERMPTGMSDKFAPEVGQIYLWCRILGALEPTTVKHIWSYKGEEMASVELTIKSSSFRTWSSKTILPEWTGDWSVKIVDASGVTLKELSFTVGGAQ